jgi:DNA/RNA endonuclease YhcR with UshA esterase domain
MMRQKWCFWTLALVFSLGVLTAFAASTQKASNSGPKYDATQEVKVKGVIEDVHDSPGEFEGTQLVVKTDTGTTLVYVAPAQFLKEMDTEFKKGDQVEVVGAKNTGAGGEQVLAKEITVGNNTTTLRDDKGVPVWSGWKAPKK